MSMYSLSNICVSFIVLGVCHALRMFLLFYFSCRLVFPSIFLVYGMIHLAILGKKIYCHSL